jgi:hypothetical protein
VLSLNERKKINDHASLSHTVLRSVRPHKKKVSGVREKILSPRVAERDHFTSRDVRFPGSRSILPSPRSALFSIAPRASAKVRFVPRRSIAVRFVRRRSAELRFARLSLDTPTSFW